MLSIIVNCVVIWMSIEEQHVDQLRAVESIASFLMWIKVLYFLRIIDRTAPLVHLLVTIIFDLRFFMIVFLWGLIMTSHTFLMIGRNQF